MGKKWLVSDEFMKKAIDLTYALIYFEEDAGTLPATVKAANEDFHEELLKKIDAIKDREEWQKNHVYSPEHRQYIKKETR